MSTSYCIVGAGAVGTSIGARLAAAGHPTSALARGATLAALRSHGWRLDTPSGRITGPVRASDDAADLGPHDVVVLAVKGQSLPAVAPQLAPLLHSETIVLTALNGVPWWFFDGIGGAYDGLRLRSVDPDGVLTRTIPSGHVVGAVVHLSASTPEPGLAANLAGRRLLVGEPDGRVTDRVRRLAQELGGADLDVEVRDDIQRAIWFKLWGNMTMNPVSAMTGATTDQILDDELVRGFCEAVMREAADVGTAIGCPIEQSVQDRVAVTRSLGAIRTSMLQDSEAGRTWELDGLLSAVREIAAATGIAIPSTESLLGLSRLTARVRGLYP